MKRSETAIVLAKIAAVDNRRLDPPDADIANPLTTPILSAWHELIGDLVARDCLEAVRQHRLTSREFLQPLDVINGVKRIRAERLRNGPSDEELMRGCDPDHPAYLAELRRRREAVATGQHVTLRAVEA